MAGGQSHSRLRSILALYWATAFYRRQNGMHVGTVRGHIPIVEEHPGLLKLSDTRQRAGQEVNTVLVLGSCGSTRAVKLLIPTWPTF
eukprot:3595295-Pleurochrysis_carterae.AAC.2